MKRFFSCRWYHVLYITKNYSCMIPLVHCCSSCHNATQFPKEEHMSITVTWKLLYSTEIPPGTNWNPTGIQPDSIRMCGEGVCVKYRMALTLPTPWFSMERNNSLYMWLFWWCLCGWHILHYISRHLWPMWPDTKWHALKTGNFVSITQLTHRDVKIPMSFPWNKTIWSTMTSFGIILISP